MDKQLSHSEIDRIIDEQEHELDSMLQESNCSDSVEKACSSTASTYCPARGIKKFWESLRVRLKRTPKE